MPRGELTLYAGTQPVFTYETVQITTETEHTDETTGETTVTSETRSALRLTGYLSDRAEAAVPESIGGAAVEQIAAGCFGGHVVRVTVPGSVNLIEEGAFANADTLIICPDGSAADDFAENAGMSSQLPGRSITFAANGGAEIAGTIEVINRNAFASCSSLKKAIVPETVVYIGSNAFTTGGLTIQGAAGSAAEEYASENGFLFVDPNATVLPESISIEGYPGMIKRGQTLQLSARILPETATVTGVCWYCADESIARISADGMLRAIAGGTTTIRAWTANGLMAEVTIEVDPTIDVERITLDATEATIGTDETLQLTAGYLPTNATYQTAAWTSSDETVALVDENGFVTPVGAGVAVIAAAAHNGLTAECTVTVYQIVGQLVLEGAEAGSAFEIGDTLQLTAKALPENALDQTVVFESSNPDVAIADAGGLITFVGSGYALITATAADRGNVTACIGLECLPESEYRLPAALTVIGEEAFTGIPAQCVVIPDGAVSIGDRAFAGCAQLYKVVIPGSVTEIAADAFDGSGPITICAPEGSYAQTYAEENGMSFRADSQPAGQ